MTPTHDYSVRVKNGAGWRAHEQMRLMISVGKEYHEGRKLEAVVDWINRNPCIKAVQVSVNDFLQRHNSIAFGMDPERAGYVSLSEGTLWIERNEAILAEISVGYSTTRWNDWFEKSDYSDKHKTIIDHMRDDPQFAQAVRADSNSLAERKKQRGEPVPDRLVECSKNYVLEELAIFSMQSDALPAVEVYPGTSLASVKYLYGRELPEKISSLSTRFVTRIDFDRINAAPVVDIPNKLRAAS